MAELVAALSLGIDLGFGQPMEHVLRQCLIALRIAEQVGLDEETRADVYYTALLVNVGCHADAHEQARWFGDDIALKADKYAYGLHGVKSAVAGMRRIGSGADNTIHRFRIGLEFAVSGFKDLSGMIEQHSALARKLGEDLGLTKSACAALDASYEQWDGKGWPGDLKGEDVPISARLSAIGEFTELAYRIGGVQAATELARKQRGKQFDPNLVDAFCENAELLLAGLDTAGTWAAVIEAEPALTVVLSGKRFDEALLAIADFIDLKSPYSLGHARAVADLAGGAAAQLAMSDAEVTTLRRAGLVHGFGRLGVSNSIWDKAGPLGAGEWERVRMFEHIYTKIGTSTRVAAGLFATQHGLLADEESVPV